MLNIDNKYSIGDTVYLLTDTEQLPRIVTAIIVAKYDLVYELYAGTTCSRHYDFEMSPDKIMSFV